MPGLISNLEGLTAILFHVEHSGDVPWQYRWRIVGNYPAPYLVWREKTTRSKFAVIHSEIRECQIEVEWRENPEEIVDRGLEIGDEGSLPSASPSSDTPIPDPRSTIAAGTWLPVSRFKLLTPTARFTINRTGEVTFSAPSGFTAISGVREAGLAAYHFPPMELEPGDSTEVTATADAPVLANVLLEPGEFRPVIKGLSITNLGPAENAWEEIPHTGPFQLSRCEFTAGRRLFAYGAESVDPALLAQKI